MKANVPRSGMGGNQANMMKQIQKMQEEMEQKTARRQKPWKLPWTARPAA